MNFVDTVLALNKIIKIDSGGTDYFYNDSYENSAGEHEYVLREFISLIGGAATLEVILNANSGTQANMEIIVYKDGVPIHEFSTTDNYFNHTHVVEIVMGHKYTIKATISSQVGYKLYSGLMGKLTFNNIFI